MITVYCIQTNDVNEKGNISPAVETKALEQIFRHKVLKMLLAKGKITPEMITLLDKWRHTGFNVFAGPRILPRNEASMENLARYITCGASACAARPGIFLSKTDGLSPGKRNTNQRMGRRQRFSTRLNGSPPRAPPINDFPTYLPVRRTQTGDEQPGPSPDDYIRDPDYPAEAYF